MHMKYLFLGYRLIVRIIFQILRKIVHLNRFSSFRNGTEEVKGPSHITEEKRFGVAHTV